MSNENTIYDRETGTSTRFVDNEQGGVSVEVTQDVTAIMKSISDMRAMSFNPKAIGRVAGQIPNELHAAWQREFENIHGVNWYKADSKTRQRFLAAKLNNSDYQKLRVWEGKL